MATIEELEARGAEMEQAEADALYALAEAMRELAVHLPDGSQLAVRLASTAKTLEECSTWSSASTSGGILDLRIFVREIPSERSRKAS